MWQSRRRVQQLLFVATGVACLLGLVLYSPWISGGARSSLSFQYRLQGVLDEPRLLSVTKETTHPGQTQVFGFTILDQLYLCNGTLYIVTTNTTKFPDRRAMISRAIPPDSGLSEEPTDVELQFITPSEALVFLGETAVQIEGFTMILYDSRQFMGHFYHWWGEIILGAWRSYASLAFQAGIPTESLPFPSRFLLPNIFENEWRDHAGVNGPLMRAAFPNAPIQRADYWDDLITLNKTIVFERAMIVSRTAAHRSPLGGKWFKMIAGTMAAQVRDNFWEVIRRTTISYVVGYVADVDLRGRVVNPAAVRSRIPIVTYISRQGGGRRLTDASHHSLVEALKELEREGTCEVNMPQMETMNVQEQLEVMGRTTILIGVHGNGLTHQLWMPPSPHSTTFEILFPGSYVFDYEMLARNLGHRHYAVWNDTFRTFPKGVYPEYNFGNGEDFQGNAIPVHGPAVAHAIRERLQEAIP